MISIVYVTNRGLYPMLTAPFRELSQYALLSQSLQAQTFTDFELIVVDADNDIPRRELKWLGDDVRYMRPKDTPWRRLHAFAPASARNTGLEVALGELVFSLDDCTSFAGDLLEHASRSWAKGKCLAPACLNESGGPACTPDGPRRGGVIFYPRKLALELGGWEERFDGSPALEDWEFSTRLHRHGVVWDDANRVTLHSHTPHDGKPYAPDRPGGYHKCPHLVFHACAGQHVANGPWTREQLAWFEAETCPLMTDRCQAQVSMYPNASPKRKFGCGWKARPSAVALEIMRTHESRGNDA